ncbi:MAG: DNA topoisomerase IV subunit A [Rickettsiales bacterium]|jgi:topoisomerase IV subunit A|nr:DNA topoisomerase IV subunit A [Rickettsiales bacterium]
MGKLLNTIDIDFGTAISERYLAYALSTITSRSLPDVRDGLKPVHRRILYAMYKLHLDPDSGYKKSARVVGDVIGKYHPHGDSSVYDALVRLAQIFASRYPLVDGQGNFGSVDGDNPAAMRYTEAKLTFVAMLLLRDIDKNTVDFNPTYDDSDSEPALLPAVFPNLLANGSEGIAVGMATSIFPHNILELLDATELLLREPETNNKDLVNLIPAPDFPTGGEIIYKQEDFLKMYETGRGSFKLRAKWKIEELPHGAYQIIITEIPYQLSKSRLLEKLADLYSSKKVIRMGQIADESSEDIRIVIIPRNRNVEANILMEQLFKESDLEMHYSLNMNVLDKHQVPRVCGLKAVLEQYIAHRYEILIRKSNFRLAKINRRLEILAGFIIVYLNLDEVIRIIRFEDEAKQFLINKFELTEVQVEAILEIKLRALQKLEEIKITKEQKALSSEAKTLNGILSSKATQQKELIKENEDVRAEFLRHKYITKRRTKLIKNHEEVNINEEELIEKEAITISISNNFWIKAIKGHGIDTKKIKYKSGDSEQYIIETQNTDKLIIATNKGQFYTLTNYKLDMSAKEGEALNFLFDLAPGEKVITIFEHKADQKYILVSDNGRGFIIDSESLLSMKKTGRAIFSCKDNNLMRIEPFVEGHDSLVVVNTLRRMVVIKLDQIPQMQKGRGVNIQKQTDSTISDIITINFDEGLNFKLNSRSFIEKDLRKWLVSKGSKGYLVPFKFPKKNKFY